jgi:hypothetical protein
VNIIILSHSGDPQNKKRNYMKNTAKKKKLTVDEIAEKAMKGEDILLVRAR